MKFKQTNLANILDEIFNSLIRSKVMDLDNPNNAKKKKSCKRAHFRNIEQISMQYWTED